MHNRCQLEAGPHLPDNSFEANVAAHVHASGERVLSVGDESTRIVLGMPGAPASDILSFKGGRYHIREVKASYGEGGADIDHALEQIHSTITGLHAADPRARIGKVEIAIPEAGNITGNFRVQGGVLQEGANDVWTAVRVQGYIVTLKRYPEP